MVWAAGVSYPSMTFVAMIAAAVVGCMGFPNRLMKSGHSEDLYPPLVPRIDIGPRHEKSESGERRRSEMPRRILSG